MPRDSECEVHVYHMGDGRCTCTPTWKPISDDSYVKALGWADGIKAMPHDIAAVKIEITLIDGRVHTYETPKIPT